MDKFYELVSKPISEYLKSKGFIVDEKIILLALILLGIAIPFLVSKAFNFFFKALKTKKENNHLHPFFNQKEIQNARKLYIQQKFQNVNPSKEDELIYTHSSVAKRNLINFFLKSFSTESEKRFFILLAGSGMGKTTFSLNLFLKYNSLFRYLFLRNKYKMILIPLGYNDADSYIQKIKENNDHLTTILVLDALDEDKKAIKNGQARIDELIELTKDFKFVILTCRTQYFNNEMLEPNEINVPRLGTKKGYL